MSLSWKSCVQIVSRYPSLHVPPKVLLCCSVDEHGSNNENPLQCPHAREFVGSDRLEMEERRHEDNRRPESSDISYQSGRKRYRNSGFWNLTARLIAEANI
jgi:hypothetical protein